MPNKKGNLFLFEAIELRNEYDAYIVFLKRLAGEERERDDLYLRRRNEEEEIQYEREFDQKEIDEEVKKLQSKRVKLNQEIQLANFKAKIDFNNENISLAEALEIRKCLLVEKKVLEERLLKSAYKRIIHKEKRDIVHEPKHSFKKLYVDFKELRTKIKKLINIIHHVNHKTIVNYRDE
jgi:hypothetical protein